MLWVPVMSAAAVTRVMWMLLLPLASALALLPAQSRPPPDRRAVPVETLCSSFCRLKCIKEGRTSLQCAGRPCQGIQDCVRRQCTTMACYENPAERGIASEVSYAAAEVPSRLSLVTASEQGTVDFSWSSSGEIYTIESKPLRGSWTPELTVEETNAELGGDEACKQYRVAAINDFGSKGYSDSRILLPPKPEIRHQSTEIYFDEGFGLTELHWSLAHPWPDTSTRSVDALQHWGPFANFSIVVDRQDCSKLPTEYVHVDDFIIKEPSYLLKLRMPEKDGCYRYKVRVAVQLECDPDGPAATKEFTIDRTKSCLANSAIKKLPECNPSEKFYPQFENSDDHDFILESSAAAKYDPERGGFYIEVSWVMSQYARSPVHTPVTVAWYLLQTQAVSNYSISMLTVKGVSQKAIENVQPDRTYLIRVSQGENKINPNNRQHRVYVPYNLRNEYNINKARMDEQITLEEAQIPISDHSSVDLLSLTQEQASILSILVVMGTFMIILLIGLLSFIVRRKVLQPMRQMPASGPGARLDNNTFYWRWNEEQAAMAHALSQSSYSDNWEIQLDDIYLYDVVLQGSYGAIYKGSIPFQNPANPPPSKQEQTALPTVVKMLAETVSEGDKFHFRKEIEILKRCGYHDNLLNLLGCATVMEPMCIILEDGCQGDLLGYLRAFKLEKPIESDYSPSTPQFNTLRSLPRQTSQWTDRQRTDEIISPTSVMLHTFAEQICAAMVHISSKGLYHRDLACRNVMLTHDYQIKIGDFSMVRYAYSHSEYLSRVTGRLPIKWMAIEVLRDQTFNARSDVWSFGIVLYELCTLGSVPFANIPSADLLKTLETGQRMEQPANCSARLYKLMLDCWLEEPNQRPDFHQIASTLSGSSGDSDGPWINLNATASSPPPLPPKSRVTGSNDSGNCSALEDPSADEYVYSTIQKPAHTRLLSPNSRSGTPPVSTNIRMKNYEHNNNPDKPVSKAEHSLSTFSRAAKSPPSGDDKTKPLDNQKLVVTLDDTKLV